MNKILSISLIIWILIDRFKSFWKDLKYGKYITTAVALVLGLLCAFTYQLDIIFELGLNDSVSLLGEILTAVALTGGSSCIAEIIEGCKSLNLPEIKKED